MAMTNHPIIVFDGMCVLCSANAEFVLRYDRHRYFRLAAMQGEAGAALMREAGVDPDDPSTLILVDGDRVLRNSTAVLAIWAKLGWPWKAAGILRLVPNALRDRIYRLVARNRYRWFGRRETCWVPSSQQASQIL